MAEAQSRVENVGAGVRKPFWIRQAPALIVLVLGLVAAAVAARVTEEQRQREERERFETRGGEIASALEKGLTGPLEVLAYFPGFVMASESVSPDEFETFAAPALRRRPSVAAIEWAPRIPGDERADFIAEQRAHFGPGFDVQRPLSGGVLEPSPERDHYLPILYRLPEREAVRGMDIWQDEDQRRAIEQSLKTGVPTVSPRFKLIDDPMAQHALIVYAPVYRAGAQADTPEARRAALIGVATALLRIEVLFERALAGLSLSGVAVSVEDLSAPERKRGLFPIGEGTPEVADGARHWQRSVAFQDRDWRITLRELEPRSGPSGETLRVAALGVMLTLLTAGAIGAASAILRLRREMKAALQLGQYRLVRRIGRGGMGTVYLAEHAMLRRPTAVKVISKEVVSEEALARFEREVRVTAELTHPNTIEIYDYGRTSGGVFYYAMEYLEGIGLDLLVARCGPQPARRVVHLLRQAAGALAEAHVRGLIHRDIKPANLMVCVRGGVPDTLRVLDFGLVKAVGDLEAERAEGDTLQGTPLYMAPEMIEAPERVGAASDVYALCAVGYFLLVGEPVFDGTSIVDVCRMHLQEPPVPPSERRPGCSSAGLDRVLLRGLAKSPDDRPANGAALLAELLAIDDLDPWSEAEAAAWWSESGAAVVRSVVEGQETLASGAGTRRFDVDFGGREAQ